MTDYKKPVYKLTPTAIVDQSGSTRDCYEVMLSDDHICGMVRFSHELGLFVSIDGGHVRLAHAWEIGPGGDWTYEREEDFETDHPGLLSDIEKALGEGRTSLGDHGTSKGG